MADIQPFSFAPEAKKLDENASLWIPPLSEFKILQEIAQGGMGIVYKVFDREQNRIAALKVLNMVSLLPSERNEEIHRFQREATISMQLQHPNLISGYRMGCEKGIWYYAMEYVSGKDLSDLVEERGYFSEPEVLTIALIVTKALDYLHQKDLIHRDIKPENILLSYEGELKICDYGLLRPRTIENDITAEGVSLGTPSYMSPEQARGDEELDIRSDIYSLGITLFHFLAGSPPFESPSITLTLSKHIFEKVPSVRKYNRAVSYEFDQILQKMTAKHPNDRYQTPQELLQDLEKHQQQLASHPQPSPPSLPTL
ncbi:MAG: serine/threonine protein kinase [Planctomycetota bacterium]|nr:MAG: serine/threonine protein kinase [Planctomycetota bacterium]